jgi:3-dehydroquinate synthase class II
LILYSGEYYKTKSEGLTAFYTLPIRAVNFKEESIEQTLSYINEIEENYAIACKQVNLVNQKILANNDWTIAKLKNILIEKGVLDREKTC